MMNLFSIRKHKFSKIVNRCAVTVGSEVLIFEGSWWTFVIFFGIVNLMVCLWGCRCCWQGFRC
jgi:hypothetical protein